MKVNLSVVMSLISDYEKSLYSYMRSVKNYVVSVSIKELSGEVTVLQDNKGEFDFELSEIERLSGEICRLKNILYEKNNVFKLPDGRSIQSAIVDNASLRRERDVFEALLVYNNSTNRVTEVNNSYFEIRKINFDKNAIMNKIASIDEEIKSTDFEISKLNSIEFEI